MLRKKKCKMTICYIIIRLNMQAFSENIGRQHLAVEKGQEH